MLELDGVVGGAAGVAAEPLGHLLGRSGQGQPAEEAGPIEVVVDAHLEIHGRALGLQAERREEPGVVTHHRAEHHLVVGALGAAEAAGHPGLHEDGAALKVPARHIHPGGGEVVVEDRFRMVLQRHGLAVEQAPPEGVRVVPDVHGRHVDRLMVHQGVEALARAEGLEGLAERGDVHQDGVVGRSPRGRVAVVGEILEQDRGLVPWRPTPLLLLEGHGVQEAAGDVGRQIGLGRVEVEQPQVLGLDPREVDLLGGRMGLGRRRRAIGRRGEGRCLGERKAAPGKCARNPEQARRSGPYPHTQNSRTPQDGLSSNAERWRKPGSPS